MDRRGVSRRRNCFGKNRRGWQKGRLRETAGGPAYGWMDDPAMDGQRPAVRAARWLQAPSRQGARLRSGRACREVSTLLLRVAITHCVLRKQLAWPIAAWRSAQAQGCLPSSTPRSHTAPLPPAGSFLKCRAHLGVRCGLTSCCLETKNPIQKRLRVKLKDSHPSRLF